jgi:hypothetical protein
MKLVMTRKWAVVSVCAAAAGVALGAGASKAAWEYFVQGPSATQIIFLPGGTVEFDSDIARFDTRSGAIYRFRGDVTNASVTNTWELRVPAVKEETSGLLEIQTIDLPRRDSPPGEAEPVAFLVDIANGDTWILRKRASTNLSWDKVDIFKKSDWGQAN